jgi:hypothetical protein
MVETMACPLFDRRRKGHLGVGDLGDLRTKVRRTTENTVTSNNLLT